MVRVEEELKHQRELMRQGFAQVGKRFEQLDGRFDAMLRRHDEHFMWLIGFIAKGAGRVVAAIRVLTLSP
jgi:hypothetical protein